MRNSRGAPIIEMVAGLIVLIPVVLYLIDLLLYVWAVDLNNMASRDAARAAACGPPTPYVGVANRAKAVLSTYKNSNPNFYIQGPTIASTFTGFVAPTCPTCTNGGTTEPSSNPGLILCCVNDPGGNGGQILGTVIVVTQMEVSLPVPILGVPQKLPLYAENQFSFTSVEPSTNSPS